MQKFKIFEEDRQRLALETKGKIGVVKEAIHKEMTEGVKSMTCIS